MFKFVKILGKCLFATSHCSSIGVSKSIVTEGEINMERKQKVDSRGKQVGMFVLKTIIYFAILMALIYLYEYSGLNSVHFIYNEF